MSRGIPIGVPLQIHRPLELRANPDNVSERRPRLPPPHDLICASTFRTIRWSCRRMVGFLSV